VSSTLVCEYRPSFSVAEQEVAHRWWTLPPGSLLPLQDGSFYRLLFAGRPGGAAGPDVRDAILVLYPLHGPRPSLAASPAMKHGTRCVGDVEFHVHASDWDSHGHQHDVRYNNVILHIVLFCDDPFLTRKQDGQQIPLCSLADLALLPTAIVPQPVTLWPCQWLMQQLSADERVRIFRHAGLLRFEQKASAFVEQLRVPADCPDAFDAYDACLLPALAEGLAYGRDRDFFRAVGLRLLGSTQPLPEPLGRSQRPSPLDAGRLQSFRRLLAQWRSCGVWQTMRQRLSSPASYENILHALRSPLLDAGLSLARTDILLINVILPFTAAVALLENDTTLFTQAERLYVAHPGLPSNTITRAMCRQLQLLREPVGSCQQQGLHYIYQQSCREKRCEVCMMSKHDL
jgi:hypothetical protein